jgi:serine/threonine protein phosphatase PrpC
MEDRSTVLATPQGLFAAVYDGHGGSRVADRAAERLHPAVARALRAGLDPAEALRRAFVEVDALTADEDCGSTVAALLLTGSSMTTAHVGDSRIVRVGATRADGLTRDHRIDAPGERVRVLRMGARLDPPYVVRGERGLMMTRSLGDRWFRPVGVIGEPEVAHHAVDPGDLAVVAATDGLWDVLGPEDAARIVRASLTAPAAARALVDTALAAGTSDNVTAVVVRLADLRPDDAAPPPGDQASPRRLYSS